MRSAILILLAASGVARAEDAASVGAAIGAGGQGASTYGALELRLDARWRGATIGLGARGVWLAGVFRRSDWASAWDAVRVVRTFEAHTDALALAIGGLAPAQLAQVADGERATLDDTLRTGVRAALMTRAVTATLEIDDVLDPALFGGAAAIAIDPRWAIHAGLAIDPTRPAAGGPVADPTRAMTNVGAAVELGLARRWDAGGARRDDAAARRDDAAARGWDATGAPDHDALPRRLELGGAIVAEPGLGASLVAFGAATIEHAGARYAATADLRAGTGTLGGAFGPLYRVERTELRSEAGGGAGLALSVQAPGGWLALGGRARPGLGGVATISAGAPMGRYVQGATWIAASRRDQAGVLELRVAWARQLASSLQIARMISTDAMTPSASWSVTAWFAVASGE